MFSNSNELAPNFGEPIPRNTGFSMVLLWPPGPHEPRQFKAVFLRNNDEHSAPRSKRGGKITKERRAATVYFPEETVQEPQIRASNDQRKV